MIRCSRNNISHISACSEYSANNAWNYNGNNGAINNNNKNNTYQSRPVLEFGKYDEYNLEDCVIPLSKIYQTYKITKRHKAGKPSHLFFELHYPSRLRELCYKMNYGGYAPKKSIAFAVTKPKLREVIAADFRDRIVQTYIVQNILPLLEEYESPYSFSCRVGKGSLKAIERMQECIFEGSQGFTKDCYISITDIRSFFMSIDVDYWTKKLIEFIQEKYQGEDKELLIYLTERTYYHHPENNCKIMSPAWLMDSIPYHKSMIKKTDGRGLGIGNVTSQTMANYITTTLLTILEGMGYNLFSFYTDDCGLVVKDKEEYLRRLSIIKDEFRKQTHLELHDDKFYFQHYSKGMNFLGFRLKYDRITPNKRIVYNFERRIKQLLNLADKSTTNIFARKDDALSWANSYLGILSHCRSYNLRKKYIDELKNSKWSKVMTFAPEYTKINIKDKYTTRGYYMYKNEQRKKEVFNNLKIIEYGFT